MATIPVQRATRPSPVTSLGASAPVQPRSISPRDLKKPEVVKAVKKQEVVVPSFTYEDVLKTKPKPSQFLDKGILAAEKSYIAEQRSFGRSESDLELAQEFRTLIEPVVTVPSAPVTTKGAAITVKPKIAPVVEKKESEVVKEFLSSPEKRTGYDLYQEALQGWVETYKDDISKVASQDELDSLFKGEVRKSESIAKREAEDVLGRLKVTDDALKDIQSIGALTETYGEVLGRSSVFSVSTAKLEGAKAQIIDKKAEAFLKPYISKGYEIKYDESGKPVSGVLILRNYSVNSFPGNRVREAYDVRKDVEVGRITFDADGRIVSVTEKRPYSESWNDYYGNRHQRIEFRENLETRFDYNQGKRLVTSYDYDYKYGNFNLYRRIDSDYDIFTGNIVKEQRDEFGSRRESETRYFDPMTGKQVGSEVWRPTGSTTITQNKNLTQKEYQDAFNDLQKKLLAELDDPSKGRNFDAAQTPEFRKAVDEFNKAYAAGQLKKDADGRIVQETALGTRVVAGTPAERLNELTKLREIQQQQSNLYKIQSGESLFDVYGKGGVVNVLDANFKEAIPLAQKVEQTKKIQSAQEAVFTEILGEKLTRTYTPAYNEDILNRLRLSGKLIDPETRQVRPEFKDILSNQLDILREASPVFGPKFDSVEQQLKSIQGTRFDFNNDPDSADYSPERNAEIRAALERRLKEGTLSEAGRKEIEQRAQLAFLSTKYDTILSDFDKTEVSEANLKELQRLVGTAKVVERQIGQAIAEREPWLDELNRVVQTKAEKEQMFKDRKLIAKEFPESQVKDFLVRTSKEMSESQKDYYTMADFSGAELDKRLKTPGFVSKFSNYISLIPGIDKPASVKDMRDAKVESLTKPQKIGVFERTLIPLSGVPEVRPYAKEDFLLPRFDKALGFAAVKAVEGTGIVLQEAGKTAQKDIGYRPDTSNFLGQFMESRGQLESITGKFTEATGKGIYKNPDVILGDVALGVAFSAGVPVVIGGAKAAKAAVQIKTASKVISATTKSSGVGSKIAGFGFKGLYGAGIGLEVIMAPQGEKLEAAGLGVVRAGAFFGASALTGRVLEAEKLRGGFDPDRWSKQVILSGKKLDLSQVFNPSEGRFLNLDSVQIIRTTSATQSAALKRALIQSPVIVPGEGLPTPTKTASRAEAKQLLRRSLLRYTDDELIAISKLPSQDIKFKVQGVSKLPPDIYSGIAKSDEGFAYRLRSTDPYSKQKYYYGGDAYKLDTAKTFVSREGGDIYLRPLRSGKDILIRERKGFQQILELNDAPGITTKGKDIVVGLKGVPGWLDKFVPKKFKTKFSIAPDVQTPGLVVRLDASNYPLLGAKSIYGDYVAPQGKMWKMVYGNVRAERIPVTKGGFVKTQVGDFAGSRSDRIRVTDDKGKVLIDQWLKGKNTLLDAPGAKVVAKLEDGRLTVPRAKVVAKLEDGRFRAITQGSAPVSARDVAITGDFKFDPREQYAALEKSVKFFPKDPISKFVAAETSTASWLRKPNLIKVPGSVLLSQSKMIDVSGSVLFKRVNLINVLGSVLVPRAKIASERVLTIVPKVSRSVSSPAPTLQKGVERKTFDVSLGKKGDLSKLESEKIFVEGKGFVIDKKIEYSQINPFADGKGKILSLDKISISTPRDAFSKISTQGDFVRKKDSLLNYLNPEKITERVVPGKGFVLKTKVDYGESYLFKDATGKTVPLDKISITTPRDAFGKRLKPGEFVQKRELLFSSVDPEKFTGLRMTVKSTGVQKVSLGRAGVEELGLVSGSAKKGSTVKEITSKSKPFLERQVTPGKAESSDVIFPKFVEGKVVPQATATFFGEQSTLLGSRKDIAKALKESSRGVPFVSQSKSPVFDKGGLTGLEAQKLAYGISPAKVGEAKVVTEIKLDLFRPELGGYAKTVKSVTFEERRFLESLTAEDKKLFTRVIKDPNLTDKTKFDWIRATTKKSGFDVKPEKIRYLFDPDVKPFTASLNLRSKRTADLVLAKAPREVSPVVKTRDDAPIEAKDSFGRVSVQKSDYEQLAKVSTPEFKTKVGSNIQLDQDVFKGLLLPMKQKEIIRAAGRSSLGFGLKSIGDIRSVGDRDISKPRPIEKLKIDNFNKLILNNVSWIKQKNVPRTEQENYIRTELTQVPKVRQAQTPKVEQRLSPDLELRQISSPSIPPVKIPNFRAPEFSPPTFKPPEPKKPEPIKVKLPEFDRRKSNVKKRKVFKDEYSLRVFDVLDLVNTKPGKQSKLPFL